MENGAIVCPNADHPGIRDVAQYNFKQMHAPRNRRPFDGDSKTPRWDKMSTKSKRRFTRALCASEESVFQLEAHCAA